MTKRKTGKSVKVIAVKAMILGDGPAKDFALNPGATVRELLDKAEIDLSDKESMIEKTSGQDVSFEDVLEDGDIIVVTKNVSSAS